MGRKQVNILCDSCDSPLRADSPFCPQCGRPTRWASHAERIEWEVRQWRTSRAREGNPTTTMMLVRTDEGYKPAPMRPEQFIWDQPLHPDREEKPVAAPASQAVPQNGNVHGNGNGHGAEPAETEIVEPTATAVPAAVDEPAAPGPIEHRATDTREVAVPYERDRDVVGISKKAVAVGILLAVGLPLSGKALNLARSSTPSPKAPAAARADVAGTIRPLALKPARSGFAQVTPDAVRYAVVFKNPNRGFAAFGIGVTVSLYDRTGRLVGRTVERIASAPAGGSIAVAGQTGVSGAVASIKSQTTVDGFEPARSSRGFVVRGVQMSRRGADVIVRGSVSAPNPARDARFVVVYLDRTGAVLGGDFTFIDVPASPRVVAAVVTTSGVSRSVARVEAYVVASP
jgi:hypothetical protein